MEGIPDIRSFVHRHEALDARMAAPDFFSEPRRAAALSREHQSLGELIALYRKLEKLDADLAGARLLAADASLDAEMRQLAREDVASLEAEYATLRHAVLVAMLPPDESDSRNTIMEIRAGAGGDEASLFASQLCRLYTRFAEDKGWRVEMLGSHPSEAGGFKEVAFLISGQDVYKTLKFESGVHRVQRVPVTEANGRIHTSTVTVAVLPEAEEVEVAIQPADLDITISRASGPGGQGVNTTDSAVQIIHRPTGVMVYCADERSQLKNKQKALTILRSRLLQARQEEEARKYSEKRRGQVGTGDRSERIRTYNFPQSRLTDHRIGFTVHNLPEVMEGALDGVIAALHRADHEERIRALTAGNPQRD